MGVCCGKESARTEDVKKPLEVSIRSHSSEKVIDLISQQFSVGQVRDMNQPITQRSGVKINALTLSLLEGLEDMVVILLENPSTSLGTMKQQMSELGIVPINWICERGYSKVLKYFMPFSGKDTIQLLCMEPSSNSEISNGLSPIHKACANGHIEIIELLYEHYRYRDTPDHFNLHFIDKNTGENGALLSVASGNLDLVKILHEKYKADFFQKNARNLTSPQIALKNYLKSRDQVYIDIFKYLIETVTVDFPTNVAIGASSVEQRSALNQLSKHISDPNEVVISVNNSNNEIPDESLICLPNCAEPWESLMLSWIPFITNPDSSILEESVKLMNLS